jgi:hypothetical protein
MSTDLRTGGAREDRSPDRYDELADEFVELLERKHRVEQVVNEPPADHPAYRGIVFRLVDLATRMETVVDETLEEHDPETACRKLV